MKVCPKVQRRRVRPQRRLALSERGRFDALWVKGVLSLYARMPDGTERAAAKRQDWRAFVRDLPEG